MCASSVDTEPSPSSFRSHSIRGAHAPAANPLSSAFSLFGVSPDDPALRSWTVVYLVLVLTDFVSLGSLMSILRTQKLDVNLAPWARTGLQTIPRFLPSFDKIVVLTVICLLLYLLCRYGMVELQMVCSHYFLLRVQLSHTMILPVDFSAAPSSSTISAFKCMHGLPPP